MRGRLRFLNLRTFYPPSSFAGDAVLVYLLRHHLVVAGHHVVVVHCLDAYHLFHPEAPEMTFTDHPNVTTYGLRSGYGWLSPLLTQQTGRALFKRKRIRELFSTNNYDVVHYHNISLLGPEVLTFTSP